MTSASKKTLHCAMLGFGEAAMAFVSGWQGVSVTAFDIKTTLDDETANAKRADYAAAEVEGCETLSRALNEAEVVFSLVTADQAFAAADAAGDHLPPGCLFLDGNSCAPGTKRRSAERITRAGGRYVDVAIMAPVHPTRHKTPISICGPHAKAAKAAMDNLDMNATLVAGDIGAASSIKMVRSIMMKGLEALVAECVTAGRKAGVDDIVLASLEQTYPGFNWPDRADYMLERMMVHGERRAAEMREVVKTIEELGLSPDMTSATVEWQQRIADLSLDATNTGYQTRTDAVIVGLEKRGQS